MDLNELVNRAVPFEFPYDDFVLTGEFYKYKVSPQYLQTLKKMEEEGTEPDEIGYKILSDSIKLWDMTAGGVAFEPSPENLKKVPVIYLVALGKHLGELRDGNPTNGASSASGS